MMAKMNLKDHKKQISGKGDFDNKESISARFRPRVNPLNPEKLKLLQHACLLVLVDQGNNKFMQD